jgi:hypothetical protein
VVAVSAVRVAGVAIVCGLVCAVGFVVSVVRADHEVHEQGWESSSGLDGWAVGWATVGALAVVVAGVCLGTAVVAT